VKEISVVIPTYNYGRFVREAIDSVLAQTRAPLEIIVVDDGSTDGTEQIVRAFGDRVRYLWQQNAGVGAARNTGIAHARGEYIAFIDSDDIWLPEKLAKQLARFDADPALGLVYSGAERFDGSGTLSVALDGIEGWIAPELLRLERSVISSGSGMMLPKRVVEEVGGFDADLQPSEDWDFCYRVALRHRIGFVPEVLVRYRQHGGGLHLDVPGMERAMMLALEKAFASHNPDIQSQRRRTYGRMHRILAGCYFRRGAVRSFLQHMLASLRDDPRNAGYFAAYPLRAVLRVFRPG
jgi:glycosyltransferase involved in cell wall biosynthesis